VGEVKLGIRVADVEQASSFYGGLGFDQIGVVPGPSGLPVLAVLVREGFHLILDALVGLPFPDSDRERTIKAGPRGLGCVIGLEVTNLQETYDYCTSHGTEITGPLQDQPWGERTFTCIDPFGYEWKFAVKIGDGKVGDTAATWFGEKSITN
jgi:uncharacterized glyoxalase superfamily protein PhnB